MLPRRVTGTACEAANVTPLIAFKRIGRTPSRSPLAGLRGSGLHHDDDDSFDGVDHDEVVQVV